MKIRRKNELLDAIEKKLPREVLFVKNKWYMLNIMAGIVGSKIVGPSQHLSFHYVDQKQISQAKSKALNDFKVKKN